jgi:hypothetical protein
MWKLILSDEQLHYLHQLLTEAKQQRGKFPLSPERRAHEAILEQIERAQREADPAPPRKPK